MTDIQTSDRDVSRAIRSWLREDRHEDASRLAGAVLDRLDATPQRRIRWWPARREQRMNKMVGFGLAAAAVVVVLIVGARVFGSPSGGVGSQATRTPEPSPTAEPSATPGPAASVAAGLPEGPHALWEDSGVAITVAIGAPNWDGEPNGGILCWGDPTDDCAGPPDGAGMITFIGSEYFVYGDACQWSTTRPDTPATTVDAFVEGLANQAEREASPPEDVTVGGYAGKKIILQMADDVDLGACDEAEGESRFGLFGVAGDDPARYSQGPGQIEEVWAVDVNGQIVVLDGTYYEETPQKAVDELRAILASATFEAP